jgi:hypothetical protein
MAESLSRRTFLSGVVASAGLATAPLGLFGTVSRSFAAVPLLDGPSERRRRHGQRVRLGAWTPDPQQGIPELERALGRRLDIVHWYQGWGAEDNAFDRVRADWVADRGGLPMVTWEPWDYRRGTVQPEYALRRIANGDHDEYLRSVAEQMKGHRHRIWLRFAHEMNGDGYPWSVGGNQNTAGDYVAAWRHVVRTFRREGATNVRFMWCPVVPSAGSPDVASCFPGDHFVDQVGMDGYNAGSEADWGGWLTLTEVFGDLYHQVRRLSRRPVIIAETGCAETGGDKSRWLRNAFLRDLPGQLPAVRAVVWFNERREADWRLQSTPESLAAARKVFTSRPFS